MSARNREVDVVLRVLPFVLAFGLIVYAFIDAATSRSDDVRNLPRLVWLLVIVVIPVVGALAWLVLGRPAAAPGNGGGGGLRSRLPRPEPRGPSGYAAGPVAPDDDPDFLHKLDEERRKAGGDDKPAS